MKTKDFSALPSAKVHFVEPMYALAVQKLPQGQEWLYEVKFDGYRCLAGRDSTGVTAAPIGMSESLAANTKLIRVAKEFGFERIVAKRKDSVYESGKRTGAWVKYRVNRGQEFVIGGYTPGNPFDALIVGYYEGDRLLYVANVRNGFVPLVRREVASRFNGLEIDTCPFANLPEKKRTQWALTKKEMKNCVWLRPQLVAQIEFAEWTPDGHLRHSKFVGLRDEKDARKVVRELGSGSVIEKR